MHIVRWGCVALAAVFLTSPGWSQSYPDKPIKIFVPLPPGSITDTTLRAISDSVSKRLGQQLIIENRPGGNMTIGAGACARSAPDGYTLCAVSGNVMSFNPATMTNLPYDVEKDFKPITQMYFLVEGIMTGKASNLNSVADLKAKAVSKPGALNFATFGTGESTDMYRQWLGKQWNTEITGIPYRGGNAIMTALLRADAALATGGLGNAQGQLQTGDIKVLYVRTAKRVKSLPDVPTATEVGLGSYPGSSPWWGLVAPVGVPDAIIDKLNAAFTGALAEPQSVKFLEDNYLDAVGGSAKDFEAFMKKDRAGVAQLVKDYKASAPPPQSPAR